MFNNWLLNSENKQVYFIKEKSQCQKLHVVHRTCAQGELRSIEHVSKDNIA